MAGNQKRLAQCVGNTSGPTSPDKINFNLNAAATWLAFGFNPDTSKSLTEVRVYLVTVTGTLGANDLTCDIYSDLNGKPNASVAGPINTVSPAAATGTFISFTFSSFALTAGTQYWIVLKNVNGTPASNFPTYALGNTQTLPPWVNGSSGLWGWCKWQTTNSGTTWGTSVAPSSGYRVGYSDGTYDGFLFSTDPPGAAATGAYGSQETGAVFVTPLNTQLNIRGVGFYLHKTGSPPGNLQFRLYDGLTLLATTNAIPAANVVDANVYAAYFAGTQIVGPGHTLRVTMGTTTGGDTSNFYSVDLANLDPTTASKSLVPFATAANPSNGVKQTVFDGANWTDTDTQMPHFMLLLDSEGEFTAVPTSVLVDRRSANFRPGSRIARGGL